MNDDLNIFRGPFKEELVEFIKYQRAQGYKYGTSIIYRFRQMDDFFLNHNYTKKVITEKMYNEWISYKDGEKKTNQMRRIIAINSFSKYLSQNGYSNIYINTDKIKYQTDFTPYIFSDEQIKMMCKKIDYLIEINKDKNYETFKILFLLYYTCGLRLSEAINLKIEDINFDTGSIRILNSKNHLSRLIVMADSLRNIFLEYYQKYYCSDSEEYIFRNNNNNKMCKVTIYKIFHKVLELSNIPRRIDHLGPRIHDLRHSFAVNSLHQMQEKGFDLYTSLPLLSKYLGHSGITETEYYLRLIPDYHKEINLMNLNYTSKIFSEVTADET